MPHNPGVRSLTRFAALILPLGVMALLGSVAGSFATNFVRVPRVSELATYRPDIVTQIVARDGSTIARYAIERRTLVTRADIPAVFRNALIATEDKNFFGHGGVDVKRTVSALFANLQQGGYAQGGSTLTQQLARAIFLSPRKTLSRKVNEALVSFEIERRYSKDQILTMYANEIYLGHGNYGVEAASRYYFGKSIKDVTLAEAALLAGIVQRPEDQSPFRNPALARARRATALRRMRAENYITEAERQAADAEPLPAAPSLPESIVGPYFSEEIRQYLEKTYGEKDLYRRGLRVESTLDPELQDWSEEALGWGLRQLSRRHGFHKPRNLSEAGYRSLEAYVDPSWEGAKIEEDESMRAVVLRTTASGAEVRVGKQTLAVPNSSLAWTGATSAGKILKPGDLVTVTVQKAKDGSLLLALDQEPREQGAVLIIENASGAIRAMVGGSDWTQSKFNRATQALRQAGSAFKPFVYLTALEQGYTGADTVFDGPLSIVIDPRQPPYRPSNYDSKFHGIVTFRKALEHSYNIPAIRVAEMVGLSRVIETAHRLGIHQNLSPYPSMPLGAFEVTLLELTSAYTVFANQGLAFAPYLIEKVTDSNGDVLETTHPDAREVESPQAAFQLLQILRGVTQRGTAGAGRGPGQPEAEHRGQDGDDERLHGCVVRRDDAPLHHRRLGGKRSEDADDRQGRRRREGRAADLDPHPREDEGPRAHRSPGGFRRTGQHFLHARRLRDRIEGDGRHADPRPGSLRQRIPADRRVDFAFAGNREAPLVHAAAVLPAQEGRDAGERHHPGTGSAAEVRR